MPLQSLSSLAAGFDATAAQGELDFQHVEAPGLDAVDCPFCRAQLFPMSDPRFAICKNERIIMNLAYAAAEYEDDYFDKEYKTQYGKSYTADHEVIIARNNWRYEHLRRFISPGSHASVLEVGSAAGYFLKIMQEEEYSVQGWEISKAMSKYANARGLKTTAQDFIKGARPPARTS
jgi:SAM-dependent methyltransferase